MTVLTGEDAAVKERQRAVWSLGDYTTVATTVIPALGNVLVDAVGIGPDEQVLDVAAGPGTAAIPAAERGATVVASDLTPALLAAGQRLAAARGARLSWQEADAEALPFADGHFDSVISCVGVMFAPRHQQSADEMVRVCRRGGTIGLLNWTPGGFVGELLATVRPYAPPPPPGAQAPALWGNPEHVAALFGNRVDTLSCEARTLTVEFFASPEAFRDFFKAHYGPIVAAYNGLAGDPDRSAALDADLAALARRAARDSDRTVMEWEYLLVTMRRR